MPACLHTNCVPLVYFLTFHEPDIYQTYLCVTLQAVNGMETDEKEIETYSYQYLGRSSVGQKNG